MYNVTAYDVDNGLGGLISFEFSNGLQESFDKFSINDTTGLITLIGNLDRETQIEYEVSSNNLLLPNVSYYSLL